jgi:hypothetical protein
MSAVAWIHLDDAINPKPEGTRQAVVSPRRRGVRLVRFGPTPDAGVISPGGAHCFGLDRMLALGFRH